jgi:hypothetical protein
VLIEDLFGGVIELPLGSVGPDLFIQKAWDRE